MKKVCPDCFHGWISKRVKCSHCNDGHIIKLDANGNTYNAPCPECKGGASKVIHTRCPKCKGIGWIDVPK